MATLPTLIYFAARGRGEVIRLVLAEAGVDYQELHVGQGTAPVNGRLTDFAELKASGELVFGALPVWEDADGFRLAQSNAIINYLGRLTGLHGKTDREQGLVDQAMGGVDDIRVELRKIAVALPGTRALERERITATFLPLWFGYFQRLLEGNKAAGGFLVGEALTIADLTLWYTLEMIRDNKLGEAMASYPVLAGFFERIQKRPRIQDYLVSSRRPLFMPLPV
jgi:glutathione S-transferase